MVVLKLWSLDQSLGLTWGLTRDASSWAPAQMYLTGHSGARTQPSVLWQDPRGFSRTRKFERHCAIEDSLPSVEIKHFDCIDFDQRCHGLEDVPSLYVPLREKKTCWELNYTAPSMIKPILNHRVVNIWKKVHFRIDICGNAIGRHWVNYLSIYHDLKLSWKQGPCRILKNEYVKGFIVPSRKSRTPQESHF